MLTVLHEDAGLLVINKPADLVCHPSKDGELSSLIGRVRLHTGHKHQIRIHLAHLGHPIVGQRLYGDADAYLAGAGLDGPVRAPARTARTARAGSQAVAGTACCPGRSRSRCSSGPPC